MYTLSASGYQSAFWLRVRRTVQDIYSTIVMPRNSIKQHMSMFFLNIYILINVLLLFMFSMITVGYTENRNEVSIVERSFPSIFQAWNGIENLPSESELQRLSRHDLVFGHPYALLKINWNITRAQPYSGLATNLFQIQINDAIQRKNELLSLNPNLLLLIEIRYRDAKYMSKQHQANADHWWEVGYYPPDSPYWLKDEEGNPVIGWGEDTNGDMQIDENDMILNYLIDFTNPEVQDLIIKKVVALEKSGLFDGVMFDWWNEENATSPIGVDDWSDTILTPEVESQARLSILRKIREQVTDDFLILVNANMRKIPLSAAYVNGIFMECYKSDFGKGYELNQILQMENTLSWAEQHLRQPRINCLEGWRMVTDYMGNKDIRIKERNSARNRQWMRMITALSLTHSDGYMLFADDNAIPSPDHLHNWYDFWDVNLGQPIQAKRIEYKHIPGLYIREFEKGWAVYNRSGDKQIVSFDNPVKGVNSDNLQPKHEIHQFDGEIFLKNKNAEITVKSELQD